jgi:pimeloyl-ACP methyl ester carboxylesterase
MIPVLTLLILTVVPLAVGFIFEQISRWNAENITPDGQFADLGTHKLHYYKKGVGGPTVVFESAFDPAGHLQWYNLQEKISEFAVTISYDRAGLLWSERGTNQKTGDNIAAELHALLEQAQVSKPYILVGHSFGGMLVRSFVLKYPQDVIGVILVDSQCPDDKQYLSAELYEMVNQGLPGTFLKFANGAGLARLMFSDMFPDGEEYKHHKMIMPALIHKSAYAILEEQDNMQSLKQEGSKIKSFGSIPLCVLSATDKNRFDRYINDEKFRNEMVAAWDKMQNDLLTLSTDSKQVLVVNSGHYINEDQPDVIVEAIRSMVQRVK